MLRDPLTTLERQIVEALPGGLVHVAKDGSILNANSAALRILGMSYDEITKRYTQDWDPVTILEDGTPCRVEDYPVSKALASGQPQAPITIGVKRPDGTISWAVYTAIPVRDDQGEISGAVVTFLDVTERKENDARRRKSEEMLRSVLESAPNPIVTTDREGHILIINRGATGVDPVTLRGEKAWERIAPEDIPKVRTAFQHVIATGEPESYECTGVSGARWLVRVGPRFEGNEIVGATFVAWDITKMRELETRLAVADRMASIGTLAAGVAHEINNPLTYLLANLDWLARSETISKERVAAAIEGAQRIRSVVSDLATFSHVSDNSRALIDVRHVLDSALRMAQGEVKYRARVVKRYEEIPFVLANDARLGQVFLNLVVNAAQAIPEGDIEKNEIVVHTTTTTDGRACVEITDTGVGISPELMPKVWEPFVTTKPRGVGTGLGLYIARNIVTSLGGDLDAKSVLGKGTTFRVVLPPAQDVAIPSDRSSEEPPPASGRKLRILVADDEVAIAWVMKNFLDDHDVHVAHSGREAINLLTSREFDLAFCDLVMPDLTGIDVYDHLRECKPGLEKRLVFMTGGAFTDRTRRFLQSVPNEVLDKPFTLSDVAKVVARRAR